MLGFPFFCRSGQRNTSLEEFDREVEGWLPLLLEIHLPRLTGQMLMSFSVRVLLVVVLMVGDGGS